MMSPKTAILYIATGRYIVFWKDFYRACEKYFLPHHQKTYFVFTDNEKINPPAGENIVKIYQENLGWPFNTLMRFQMFMGIEEQLKKFDYIFFLNANMLPVAPIEDEILPTAEQGLMVTIHPGAYLQPKSNYPYETNPQSTAYTDVSRAEHYFMGGFNGGTSAAALQAYRTMMANVQKDLEKDIIAIWHDESHLNSYILDKNPLILLPEYGFPEGWHPPEPLQAKIIILDKGNPKYGGHKYLRGITNRKQSYIRHYLGWCKDRLMEWMEKKKK